MPRKPNQLKTVPLPLSTTLQIEKYLRALVATGFYGKNPIEAAERLLARTLEDLAQRGIVKLSRR